MWESVIARARSRGYRLLFIDVSGTVQESYRKKHSLLREEIMEGIDRGTREHYKLFQVPETRVLNAEGRTLYDHVGVLNMKDIRRLLTALM